VDENQPVSIPKAAASLPGAWAHSDLVAVNDAIVRVARIEGENEPHQHRDEELFLC
jgi:hypothetical protein